MDNSFHRQGSGTQQDPKNFLVSLPILGDLIKWLASLILWTEEEQDEAGIYLDRLGGEQIASVSPANSTHRPQLAVMISH